MSDERLPEDAEVLTAAALWAMHRTACRNSGEGWAALANAEQRLARAVKARQEAILAELTRLGQEMDAATPAPPKGTKES